MASVRLNAILKDLDKLTPQERAAVAAALERAPAPTDETLPPTKDDESARAAVLQELIDQGLVRPRNPSPADLQAFRYWKPVKIAGKPLSDTILDERR